MFVFMEKAWNIDFEGLLGSEKFLFANFIVWGDQDLAQLFKELKLKKRDSPKNIISYMDLSKVFKKIFKIK